MLGATRVSGDKRQVNFRLDHGGELALGLLSCLLEALHGHGITAQVDALLALKLAHQPVNDALIEVVATEVRIAIGGLHLNDISPYVQDRNIKGAAAKIVHRDGL